MNKITLASIILATLVPFACVKRGGSGPATIAGLIAKPDHVELPLRVPVTTRSTKDTGTGGGERPDGLILQDAPSKPPGSAPSAKSDTTDRSATSGSSSNTATLDLSAMHCPSDEQYGAVALGPIATKEQAVSKCAAEWQDCCELICATWHPEVNPAELDVEVIAVTNAELSSDAYDDFKEVSLVGLDPTCAAGEDPKPQVSHTCGCVCSKA